MTDHFFRETQPGYIKHTAASKALAVMPVLGKWASMGMYEVGPAKMHVRLRRYFATIDAYYGRLLMRLLNGQSLKSHTMRSVMF
jgi:hypothetical protein